MNTTGLAINGYAAGTQSTGNINKLNQSGTKTGIRAASANNGKVSNSYLRNQKMVQQRKKEQ